MPGHGRGVPHPRSGYRERMAYRLTQYAHGGGCACKIPPGELQSLLAHGQEDPVSAPAEGPAGRLLLGGDDGDDAAVWHAGGDRAIVTTADFITPVLDDPHDWGRVAAANALSDVYAVGAQPLLGINLLAWPRETLPLELAAEVLRGGAEVLRQAGCHPGGGHTVDDPEPKYGLAVTGCADPKRLLRLDAGRAGSPLSLTKPLGLGVLNARHQATGESFPEAIATMTTLNRDAGRAALDAGATCATDVTGFGLLGHLANLADASGVTAVVNSTAVPYLAGAREAARDGFVSGGTRRNLAWAGAHTDFGSVDEFQRLLLADAQTSGGLLVAGEVPGHPIIGELVSRGDHPIVVR